jgi:uncharacterized protein (UPF0332 family)
VKPEVTAYLRKSREFLMKAQGMLEQGWPDEAGRAAYLAGFHAAQALIFERTGKVLEMHSGVQTQFALMVKDTAIVDIKLRRFLGRAYNLKELTDYATGPGAEVSAAQAKPVMTVADRFVAAVAALLGR